MNFDGILGNKEVKEYLSQCVKNGKISQSYLFVGTDGIRKIEDSTTMGEEHFMSTIKGRKHM